MIINEYCKDCQLRRNIDRYPATASADEIAAYQRGVRDLIAHCEGLSTPQISEKMRALRHGHFGPGRDFTAIKRHFNSLMLNLLPHMQKQVAEADDALRMAVQYSMVGNFIDFGALDNVDEQELLAKLDAAKGLPIAPGMLESFRREVEKAQRLVLFTDNCGEIVTDKLLLSVLRDINPHLSVTVIVRGRPVVNDATLEDARQIGMGEVARRVIGNGAGMPGNVLGAISPEAMEEIGQADVLVSKGQGNYEGLSGCGLNIFYLFLCKCDAFTQRFNVPRFTGVMTRERVGQEG
ncbi:MAG: ARMT1-like domain-containing protein [Bacteroidales bacterium]|nr:ARMT1-like domain-containing protein [Bacteroidales bacterium]